MILARSFTLGALLLFAAASAQAIDFKSVGADPVVAYDAPGAKGRKVFVVPRGAPVEAILSYGDWTKVRDSNGDLFWLETKSLTGKRTLIVKAGGAKARASADETSALVFTADKGVLLDLAEPVTSGWVKVKHRDGQTGYVKAGEIWGSE